MNFEAWSSTAVSKTPVSAYNSLKEVLNSNLFKAVSGVIGQELSNSKYPTGLVKPAFDTLMSFI
jgi:hypothetical protein